MNTRSNLSIQIDSQIKKALILSYKERGLKIQTVIENAIYEYLEEEIDLLAFELRTNEQEISLATVLKKLKNSHKILTKS
jgi:hypothetical protein